MSFSKNGREAAINASAIGRPVTAAKYGTPTAWQDNIAAIPVAIAGIGFLIFRAAPHITARGIYPKINPPLGPRICPIPPENPVNNGSPIAPRTIYVAADNSAQSGPVIYPAKATAKVARVIGTPLGSGIAVWDNIAMTAVDIAAIAIFFVLFEIELVFFTVTAQIC